MANGERGDLELTTRKAKSNKNKETVREVTEKVDSLV